MSNLQSRIENGGAQRLDFAEFLSTESSLEQTPVNARQMSSIKFPELKGVGSVWAQEPRPYQFPNPPYISRYEPVGFM